MDRPAASEAFTIICAVWSALTSLAEHCDADQNPMQMYKRRQQQGSLRKPIITSPDSVSAPPNKLITKKRQAYLDSDKYLYKKFLKLHQMIHFLNIETLNIMRFMTHTSPKSFIAPRDIIFSDSNKKYKRIQDNTAGWRRVLLCPMCHHNELNDYIPINDLNTATCFTIII